MVNLTPQERQATLFLIALAMVGIGINFFAKRCSPVNALIYLNQNIGKVELNQADKQALIEIPGIGEKLAQRILEYRQKNGGFKDSEELKKIKDITNYRYEKLKDFLYVK